MTDDFVVRIPKVELHVHLEGAIRPETVLELAKRHGRKLPADTPQGLAEWYRFRDFRHFVEVYVEVSKCVKTAEDVETIAKEFLEGQARQNILHSEITYTASTIETFNGIPWADQLAALQSALAYAREKLGLSAAFILDIVRGHPPERAVEVAQWAIDAHGKGVCALGVAGEEWRGTRQYERAFCMANEAGLPVVAHAGETVSPESIWEVLEVADPVRIGHGVRCLEDPELVRVLRDRQIPLEVCPSSNVCLGIFPSWEEHPLPKMLDEGLFVTINSDDPPMFGTTLTGELERASSYFGFGPDILWSLTLNAANAALITATEREVVLMRLREGYSAAGA